MKYLIACIVAIASLVTIEAQAGPVGKVVSAGSRVAKAPLELARRIRGCRGGRCG